MLEPRRQLPLPRQESKLSRSRWRDQWCLSSKAVPRRKQEQWRRCCQALWTSCSQSWPTWLQSCSQDAARQQERTLHFVRCSLVQSSGLGARAFHCIFGRYEDLCSEDLSSMCAVWCAHGRVWKVVEAILCGLKACSEQSIDCLYWLVSSLSPLWVVPL